MPATSVSSVSSYVYATLSLSGLLLSTLGCSSIPLDTNSRPDAPETGSRTSVNEEPTEQDPTPANEPTEQDSTPANDPTTNQPPVDNTIQQSAAADPDNPLPINNGTYQLNVTADQWFLIEAKTQSTIVASIAGVEGDLDLYLFELTSPDPIAGSFDEQTSNERIEMNVPAGEYVIGVSPWENQGGRSELTVQILPSQQNDGGSNNDETDDGNTNDNDDTGSNSLESQFEPDNTPDNANAVAPGKMNLVGNDDDWFYIDVNSNSTLNVTIASDAGDLDLYVVSSSDFENPIGSSYAEDSSNEQVQVQVGPGRYFILVTPWEGLVAPYEIEVALTSTNQDTGGNGSGAANGNGGNAGSGLEQLESFLAGGFFSYRNSESSGSDPNFPIVFVLETYIDVALCSDGTYQAFHVSQSSFSGREEFFYRGTWEIGGTVEAPLLIRTVHESDDPSIVLGSSGFQQGIELNQNGTVFMNGERWNRQESNPICN